MAYVFFPFFQVVVQELIFDCLNTAYHFFHMVSFWRIIFVYQLVEKIKNSDLKSTGLKKNFHVMN